MRALATQRGSLILILVYCWTASVNGAPKSGKAPPSVDLPPRLRRQVSIDDLLSTALQIVRPIFDTAQPLPFDSVMIPKRMSAEHSTGARESKILGAPAYSSLREVPICRGNSQICKFISCTAHNFKYDQNLSNLNLAAQLINDKDMRRTISQNPEAITTVCHEQGLSTEQCRLFSRAFQLIDRFMTSIQKPEGPSTTGQVEGGSGDGNDDDEDDGIIGSATRKSQHGNRIVVTGATSPTINTLVMDDDGDRPSSGPEPEFLTRSNFFGGRVTNAIAANSGSDSRRRIISSDSAPDDDFVDSVASQHMTSPAPQTTKLPSSKTFYNNPNVPAAVGGSRTWSTHFSSNKDLYHELDDTVSRKYGRDPFQGPLARPAGPLRQNATRISTNAQFVTFSRANATKNSVTKSRPVAPRAAPQQSTTRSAPHAVPPRLATVLKQHTTTVVTKTRRTTTVAPISPRPYDAKRQNKSFDEEIDFNADYIPEAEDYLESQSQSRDVVLLRRRASRAAPPIIAANADYYDDLKSDVNHPATNKNDENGGSKAPPPAPLRQNCFQYLG